MSENRHSQLGEFFKPPWQIGAPRVTLVAHARGALSRAIGRQLGQPCDDSSVATVAVDDAVQGVTTESTTLATTAMAATTRTQPRAKLEAVRAI